MKKILKKILPDPVIRLITGLFYGWHGNYRSWEEAEKKCTGYDSEIIFKKAMDAALKVKNGDAAWERDTVLFYQPEYSAPLVDAVTTITSKINSTINILDFGGSLGSTYFQHKDILGDSIRHWCIVEQEGLVNNGKAKFENDTLHFFLNIDEVLDYCKIDLLILSSVLQYIKEPYRLLYILLKYKPRGIFIDRTPFISGHDRLTIQKVHPRIYKAKYPCWFFNEEKFRSYFIRDYELIFSFNALDKANIKSEFKGFFYRRKGE